MRLEHHLVGGYVRYISPHIIIIIITGKLGKEFCFRNYFPFLKSDSTLDNIISRADYNHHQIYNK